MSVPYRTCPYCGSNLDPAERCDCRDSQPHEADQTAAQDAAQPTLINRYQPALAPGA